MCLACLFGSEKARGKKAEDKAISVSKTKRKPENHKRED
jgi:hypothetical protein